MASGKSGKKTIGIWTVVSILVISACFLLSIIQTPEAYGEKKKITGTSKVIDVLAMAKIPIAKSPVKGKLIAYNAIFSSADPDWNNARFFFVRYQASIDGYKGFGVVNHPGGDQTFIEFDDKVTSATGGSEQIGEISGFFLKGTGKFENIRARWKSKWVWDRNKGNRVDEWVVEYF